MPSSDPFAATSKALGRAEQRRRDKERRQTNNEVNASASFDSTSQPPLPSRRSAVYTEPPQMTAAPRASRTSAVGPRVVSEKSILDVLPPEYRYNPKSAAPILYHLQKALEGKNGESKVDVPLDALLNAADNDVRLHRARVQAGIHHGESKASRGTIVQ